MLSAIVSFNICNSLIGVAHRAWPTKIARVRLNDPKSCSSDEIVHFAIEVTTACNMFPERSIICCPLKSGFGAGDCCALCAEMP